MASLKFFRKNTIFSLLYFCSPPLSSSTFLFFKLRWSWFRYYCCHWHCSVSVGRQRSRSKCRQLKLWSQITTTSLTKSLRAPKSPVWNPRRSYVTAFWSHWWSIGIHHMQHLMRVWKKWSGVSNPGLPMIMSKNRGRWYASGEKKAVQY